MLLLTLAAALHPQNVPPVETIGPAAWPNVPATVVEALDSVGCRVPQPTDAAGKTNLIQGRLAHAKQQDWAALCIDDADHAHIEVVWGQDKLCPSLPPMKIDLLHTRIVVASPRQMREYESLYAGFSKHARLATHDGIELSGSDSSIVYFCVNGNWAERQGRARTAG